MSFEESQWQNDMTISVGELVKARSAREAFTEVWPALHRLARVGNADYVVAAVGPDCEVSTRAVVLVGDEPRDLIVGRHSRVDLQLRADPSVALRHLLLRFYRVDGRARVRLLDLHTEVGLIDEDGALTTSVMSDGHLVVSVASYSLVIIPRMDTVLPADPAEAWDALPTRRLLEAAPPQMADREGLRLHSRLEVVPEDGSITGITHLEAPLDVGAVDLAASDAVGALTFSHAGREVCVRVRGADLAAGLLIGRYERCDVGLVALLTNNMLSRVHLCLLLDEAGLWAIDTATTNGSLARGESFRSYKLGAQDVLELAGEVSLRWRSA